MKILSKSSYSTVLEERMITQVIKKSKFLSYIIPCTSEEAFLERLQAIKKEHASANHHCYAYRFNGHVIEERYKDDGEPSGTAGLPILDVLRGQEILQCGIVVVRYFGGTKLGTGGLSRAYSDGARDVLKEVDIVTKEEAAICELEVDYGLVGKLDYYIEQEQLAVVNKAFGAGVIYTLALRSESLEPVVKKINEISNGTIIIKELDNRLGFFSDNKFIEG